MWIKSFLRSKDGRGAWTAFKAHYLGMAQLDTTADCADSRIENLVYNGEKSRYSFETHVSNFKKAHLDLKRVGNKLDDRSKVCKFLQSLKAQELQTAVGVVKLQDSYLKDFKLTINYLHRFVLVTPTNNCTIAAASITTRGNEKPPKPPGISWWCYQRDEFKKLPESAKAWLIWENKRRNKEGKSEKKKEKHNIKSQVQKEKRKLAKLKAKAAKLKSDAKDKKDKNSEDAADSHDSSVP